MAEKRYKIHENYNVYFTALGNTRQTKTTILSTETFDENSPMQMVSPGRLVLIGDTIEDDLRDLIEKFGLPALGDMTAVSNRARGVFSTRGYGSLIEVLYPDQPAPRTQGAKKEKPRPTFRDAAPALS